MPQPRITIGTDKGDRVGAVIVFEEGARTETVNNLMKAFHESCVDKNQAGIEYAIIDRFESGGGPVWYVP